MKMFNSMRARLRRFRNIFSRRGPDGEVKEELVASSLTGHSAFPEESANPGDTQKPQREFKTYVIFSEGDAVEIQSEASSASERVSLQQLTNLTRALEMDDAGAHVRESKLFPDGHVMSPFRGRIWKVKTKEEYQTAPQPTEEEKALWKKLHDQDAARFSQYERESALWFEAMGRYVASFESMVSALMELIRAALTKSDLKSLEIKEILLANRAAQEIQTLARTIFFATAKPSEQEVKISDAIFHRVRVCIETRNDVVHSSWLPGGEFPMHAKSFLVAEGSKLIMKESSGTAHRRFDYDCVGLNWLRERCVDARLLVSDLTHRLHQNIRPLNYFLSVSKDNSISRTLNYAWTRGQFFRDTIPPAGRHPPAPANEFLAYHDLGSEFLSLRIANADEFVARANRTPLRPGGPGSPDSAV